MQGDTVKPVGGFRRRSAEKGLVLRPSRIAFLTVRRAIAQLDDELQAADVAWLFASPLDRPSHLHQCGNRDGNIGSRECTAQEQRSLEWGRTQDTNAAIAEIVNAAVKFLRQRAWGLTREQASPTDSDYLREALMLASFAIGELGHN